MKNIINYVSLISLLLLASSSFAQHIKYKLEVDITNLNPKAMAYLIKDYGAAVGTVVLDTLEQKNRKFVKNGLIEEPQRVYIVVDHEGTGVIPFANSKADQFDFYLEEGNITFKSVDSIKNASINAGTTNEIHNSYKEIVNLLLNSTFNKMQIINKRIEESTNNESEKKYRDEFNSLLNSMINEHDSIRHHLIINNRDSYVSLDLLLESSRGNFESKKMVDLFKTLSPRIQQSHQGKPILQKIEKLSYLAEGEIAPDFTQNDVNGIPVSLSDFRGQYVLLDFWASWCGPCRDENPYLVEAYESYKDKGFTVLGISLDVASQKNAWLTAIKDDKLTWANVSDLQGRKNSVAILYNVTAIPKNFLIDPKGKIVAKNLRGEELKKILYTIFGDL